VTLRVPIRIIGLATSFFWIFLIAFSASAVYSVKDVQFDFKEPQISSTDNDEALISLPITIVNKGLYNLGHFDISTRISNEEGMTITQGSTFIPIIERGETVNTVHNMTMNLDDLSQTYTEVLFNDTELPVYTKVSISAAEVIPVQAIANLSIPWGAPLHNFALGTPRFETLNQTHSRVVIPMSFDNHAFFDLIGTLDIRLYNRVDVIIGETQIDIDTPQDSSWQRQLELDIPIDEVISTSAMSGRIELDFTSQYFNFGPLVIPYGG
jgi:hypothetical protein